MPCFAKPVQGIFNIVNAWSSFTNPPARPKGGGCSCMCSCQPRLFPGTYIDCSHGATGICLSKVIPLDYVMHAYDNEAMTSLCRHPCICPITANGVPRTHSNNPTGHNTKLSKVYMNGVNLR